MLWYDLKLAQNEEGQLLTLQNTETAVLVAHTALGGCSEGARVAVAKLAQYLMRDRL